MTVKIQCQGATTVGLDELFELQGNLKDLTEENYVKLRNSITEYGFSFPIFFWTDPEGKKLIIDSHQRKRTLLKMRDEGWTIPPLPADPIFAADKTEAKKKLLLLNSRFGKIQLEGYEEFINEADSMITDSFKEEIEIPEITLWGDPERFNTPKDETTPTDSTTRQVVCPNCSHQFNAKEHLAPTE